ncbi:MAG: CRISPR-associated protein Cas4 [Cetobacterium sp.]
MKITGVMFYYYFICHRKLWHFSKGLGLESSHENVQIGKVLDKTSYSKEKKNILFDNTINIDFLRDWKVLHEIKKTKEMEKANIWQLKYYLYYLKKSGIEVEKGILDYPKLKIRDDIFLTEEDQAKIETILNDIEGVCEKQIPPCNIKSKICKNCAYYEFCYI